MKSPKSDSEKKRAAIQIIGGMPGVERLLRGETRVVSVPKAGLLRELRLGNGLVTADDFRTAFKHAGMKTSIRANDILDNPSLIALAQIEKKERDVELVIATPHELGCLTPPTLEEVCMCAMRFGLIRCTPEIGPQLRVQYPNQSKGEWLVIAMKPITRMDGYIHLYQVAHHADGLFLCATNVPTEHRFDMHTKFVFMKSSA